MDFLMLKPWICLALAISPASAAGPVDWKLVWSDEFETPGQPDAAKWGRETGMIRNNEKQFYTKDRLENARVENGHLIIESRKETHEGAEFTSASLTTAGHAAWTGGRIEVRAKLPAARGTWPAIWMLPTDIDKIPWPKCGEIDIMEHVGHDPAVIHGTLHTETYNHLKGTQLGGVTPVPSFASDFHIYAAEWTGKRISFSVDGKGYASFARKDGDTAAEWPFEKPYYLILNLAIGGSWGGQKGIDEGAFPQRMEVDYVRVYQPAKSGAAK
jgi:beta-glucanase (GH16 family)